jgi:hypothetical protein
MACKKTGKHINDPTDILGGALVFLHTIFLGLFVALHLLLENIFPEWLAGIAVMTLLIVFEMFFLGRALK